MRSSKPGCGLRQRRRRHRSAVSAAAARGLDPRRRARLVRRPSGLLGRSGSAMKLRASVELLQRRAGVAARNGPPAIGGLHRVQPRAQHPAWFDRLARENEGDDRNHQRKKIERRIEHRASRRSARCQDRRVKHSTSAADRQARRGSRPQRLAAVAKQRGKPSTVCCRHHAIGSDQGAGFLAAEILLMQDAVSRAVQRIDPRTPECESGRHSSNAVGPVRRSRCIWRRSAGISRDRCGTAGPRPACCRGPFRRARAASAPRAPAPCRRGRRSAGSARRSGRRARICRAIEISSRCGLSMQAAAKALAVERLMPA